MNEEILNRIDSLKKELSDITKREEKIKNELSNINKDDKFIEYVGKCIKLKSNFTYSYIYLNVKSVSNGYISGYGYSIMSQMIGNTINLTYKQISINYSEIVDIEIISKEEYIDTIKTYYNEWIKYIDKY